MKKILYLGTDPTHFKTEAREIVHYPVIAIVPRPLECVTQVFSDLGPYTHILFTSKNGVALFFSHLKHFKCETSKKIWIAIGAVTAQAVTAHFRAPDFTAHTETQEGLIALLKDCIDRTAHVLLPRSSLSRPVLTDFFKRNHIAHVAFDLYDTVFQKPFDLDLNTIDEIAFTSPSTVTGFMRIFGVIPKDKTLRTQGPITHAFLQRYL